MASPENPSKRERQKQRRDAKLEQQRIEAAKSRRNRLIAFALLGLVFVGLIGASIARKQATDAAAAAKTKEAEEARERLGCTPNESQEDLGGGHLDGSTLAQQPPDALYPDRPPTSGQHVGNVLKTGVYDVALDERLLVHNLEHGYVVGYYSEDAPTDQVSQFKAYAQEQIDGDFQKIIVAPWDGDLPGDASFAYTSWAVRQTCAEYDDLVFDNFLTNHHGGESLGEENGIPPHLEGGNGTIDPEGKPVLLPPLGDDEQPEEQMTEGGDAPASEEPAEDSS